MSDTIPGSIERATSELLASNDTAEIERALVPVSEASASLEQRSFLQDAALFERLLDIYVTTYSAKEPPKELLRCIGNLVSDNGKGNS